jgi:hypothetical protein
MISASQKKNIIIQYLVWHFFDLSKEIIKAWKNFLLFNLNYFSIFLLLKTFFSPWRKYQWSYGRGFDPKRYLEAFFSNSISRILGAIIRSFLIVIGLLAELFIFLVGLFIFLAWLFLPFLIIISLIISIKLVF